MNRMTYNKYRFLFWCNMIVSKLSVIFARFGLWMKDWGIDKACVYQNKCIRYMNEMRMILNQEE